MPKYYFWILGPEKDYPPGFCRGGGSSLYVQFICAQTTAMCFVCGVTNISAVRERKWGAGSRAYFKLL